MSRDEPGPFQSVVSYETEQLVELATSACRRSLADMMGMRLYGGVDHRKAIAENLKMAVDGLKLALRQIEGP